MQTMAGLITQIALYVIYLPIIINQPVEEVKQSSGCAPVESAQYRIYLPLILNQKTGAQVSNEPQPEEMQYHVYLPLIMAQRADCPPTQGEHRIYLPIIMNQVSEKAPTPQPTPTEVITEHRIYLPIIMNQPAVNQIPVNQTPVNQPPVNQPVEPTEYHIYLPLILNQLPFERQPDNLENVHGFSYHEPNKTIPDETPSGALDPIILKLYVEKNVDVQLRSLINNHKPGSTLITTCGQMHEVRIEFREIYPNANIEIVREEQGLQYIERFPLTRNVITIESSERVKVTMDYLLDGQPITVVASPTTINTSEISEVNLIRAGYCRDSNACQRFKQDNTCNGIFSWDILFM